MDLPLIIDTKNFTEMLEFKKLLKIKIKKKKSSLSCQLLIMAKFHRRKEDKWMK